MKKRRLLAVLCFLAYCCVGCAQNKSNVSDSSLESATVDAKRAEKESSRQCEPTDYLTIRETKYHIMMIWGQFGNLVDLNMMNIMFFYLNHGIVILRHYWEKVHSNMSLIIMDFRPLNMNTRTESFKVLQKLLVMNYMI